MGRFRHREGRVGYYSCMSQFNRRARIVIDVDAIRSGLAEYGDENAVAIEREAFKTATHEYGHVMVELMNFSARQH